MKHIAEYSVAFNDGVKWSTFRRRKPKVLVAFPILVKMWLVHCRSCEMVTQDTFNSSPLPTDVNARCTCMSFDGDPNDRALFGVDTHWI